MALYFMGTVMMAVAIAMFIFGPSSRSSWWRFSCCVLFAGGWLVIMTEFVGNSLESDRANNLRGDDVCARVEMVAIVWNGDTVVVCARPGYSLEQP